MEKKVYCIMLDLWHDGGNDHKYTLFGSHFYLSKDGAERKCAELQRKFNNAIKNSTSTQRREYVVEYRYLNEE